VGWLWTVLLACAVAVLVAAEWPRVGSRFGWEGRRARSRARRKAELRLLKPEPEPEQVDDSDEFAASVKRDLAQLPTTNDPDRS
jgi:hypothetical protein